MSGSEKFLLKSNPHSPIATHSGFSAIDFNSSQDSSVYDLASCGCIPKYEKLQFVYITQII